MSAQTFGVLLEDVTLENELPKPVNDTIQYFNHSTRKETEGLFRIPGNTTSVNEIKSLYNEGKSVTLEQYDIHTVASVFKAYFRELPDSLVTEENTDLFLVFIELDQIDKNLTISKLQNVLVDLPPIYFSVLKSLIGFLVEVSQCSVINKMNSHNLALIFGPNIFNKQDAFDMLRPDNPATTCTKYFIDNFHSIFDGLKPNPVFQPPVVEEKEETKEETEEPKEIEETIPKPISVEPTSSQQKVLPQKPLPPLPTKSQKPKDEPAVETTESHQEEVDEAI
ncbi:RhoGAP domain containing protein [Entamoeba marina]